jgi:hypothetical protein
MTLSFGVQKTDMEKLILENDILTHCITASSFPEGVQAAHEQLHKIYPADGRRRYFGISHGYDGGIIYKAAAELMPGDEITETESFLIKKGNYNCITIHKFMENIPAIGKAFEMLLKSEGLDPQGYCLEWYRDNNTVQCMVPIITSNNN